jgi:H+/Cl- antiporter ClcA
MTLAHASSVLQLAVSPAILISACGLLILSMSNRLGRAIDRARSLSIERKNATDLRRKNLDRQMEVIRHRCGLIRSAILFCSICILLTAILILALFILTSVEVEAGLIIAIIFCGSILSLAVALVFFTRDVFLALKAMETEINGDEKSD